MSNECKSKEEMTPIHPFPKKVLLLFPKIFNCRR